MPLAQINDHACHYRLDGADDAPVLVLSHSLGVDLGMWDEQAADLRRHFRVLRYDLRGHGASTVSPGDYSIALLGRDVLALVDSLGIDRFAFCGLSIGGMIGQWLGVSAPARLTHLVIANSSPRPDAQGMETRRRTVLESGLAAIADTVIGRFFSPPTVTANPPSVSWARRTLGATSPIGYAACCAAIRDFDGRAHLESIPVPTLVICGDADPAMGWEGHSEILAQSILNARVVRLPAAHLSNLEAPRAFTAALYDFLRPATADPLTAGAARRRHLLGDAHVDRSIAGTTDFTRAFQDLITRFAWGTIWTRPGLDDRVRRLLVIAMMASLGRWEEFRLHVRTGLAHELEPCDLEEVLLQVAVYAGVPAANTAFHLASEELAAKGAKA